jgi:hypothetical protein
MKKYRLGILLIILLSFTICLFYQCDKKEKEEQSNFRFPKTDTLDAQVYNQIKITCEIYWDLSKMIDSTFEIIKDGDEYIIQCDGIIEGQLYRFVIRVDKNGKWINDGRSKKE